MTDLDLLSRSLARVRGELSPSTADKVRLRARIMAPPAPSTAPIEAFAPARLTRWAAVRRSGGLGLSLGVLLLGAGVAIGFWWGNEPGSRASVERAIDRAGASLPPAHGRFVAARAVDGEELMPGAEGNDVLGDQPALSANAPPAAEPATAPVMAPAAAPKKNEMSARPRAPARDESAVHGHTKRPGPRQASADGRLGRELALLRRVERALRANDPSLALALLEELDAAFPDTRLGEERLAARRIAECRAGKPGAVQSARRFILEHGSSVYRQRIGLACESGNIERGNVEHGRAPMKNAETSDTHSR